MSAELNRGGTHMGDDPRGWQISKMGRHMLINDGLVDPRIEPWASQSLIAPNHIESGTARIKNLESARDQGADSGKYFARQGQVLYSKIRPALNKVALAPVNCLCSADMYAMSSRHPNDDSRFLVYYMLSRPFLDYTTQISMRVKMPKVNREELSAAPWLRPPADEQRAIADYLDQETAQIDALVAKQKEFIGLLRERRQTVVRTATGWGRPLPEGWRYSRLSHLFRSTGSGTTPANEDILDASDGDVAWVTTGELRERRIEDTHKSILHSTLQRYSALKVYAAGTLLVAMYGATIGRTGILKIPAATNQACCALVGPVGAIAEFVEYSLIAGREWLLLGASGGGQPNINQDKVRGFRIPVPPVDEQREIVRRIEEQTSRIDTLIAKAEEHIALAKERRATLITAAVTGQFDVRSARKAR